MYVTQNNKVIKYKEHMTKVKIYSTEAKEPFIGPEPELSISRSSARNS